MKNLIYLLFVSIVIVSCGQPEKSNLTSFELKDKEGTTIMSMNDTGLISLPSAADVKIRINENYEILDKDDKVRLKLNEEGVLVTEDGETITKVSENGEMDNGSGENISWSENGELMKGAENTGITISPNDPDAYKVASILLSLYFLGSDGSETTDVQNDSITVTNPQVDSVETTE